MNCYYCNKPFEKDDIIQSIMNTDLPRDVNNTEYPKAHYHCYNIFMRGYKRGLDVLKNYVVMGTDAFKRGGV